MQQLAGIIKQHSPAFLQLHFDTSFQPLSLDERTIAPLICQAPSPFKMSTPAVPSPNSSNNTRNDECQKAAEDLWDQAIQNLSEHEQQRLASLRNEKLDVLNAVLDEVETKKQRCLDKRWTYKGRDGKPKVLHDLCDKTIAWVTKFKELGDTFVKCASLGMRRCLGRESVSFFRWVSAVLTALCNS